MGGKQAEGADGMVHQLACDCSMQEGESSWNGRLSPELGQG